MARASKALAASSPKGTALATIDQELANEVTNIQNMIAAPSGNKIKIEPSGDFVLPDGTNLGNEIQVVVLDFAYRNLFYSGPYNPNNITPPDCYSISSLASENNSAMVESMAPEEDSPTAQSDKCGTCPLNAFGSSNNGKGKACQNRCWVSVLLVDPDNPEAHSSPDAPLYLMDISPSNLKGFAPAIRNTTRLLGHYIKAIFTVRGSPAGTYGVLQFEHPVMNPDYAAHAARRAESRDALVRRPDFTAAAAAAPARGRAAPPARRAAAARR